MGTIDATQISVSLTQYSMLSKTRAYECGGTIFFGLMRDPIMADPTDMLFMMTKPCERRLDLISTMFYGTPRLWWIIAMVNNLNDPLSGVAFGSTLRIPSRHRISAAGLLNT
jgi:hypothetical protein